MKLRKILLPLSVLLLLAVTVSASFAYFTARSSVKNVFTVGSVDIKLEEPDWNPDDPHEAIPGAEFAKNPTVKNTGRTGAYVRVHVEISDYTAFVTGLPSGYDLSSMFSGGDSSKWTLAGEPVVNGVDDTITYTYYYKTVLAAGEETGPLFEKVTIPTLLTESAMTAMDGEFSVTVIADAIQELDTFQGVEDAFVAFDDQRN